MLKDLTSDSEITFFDLESDGLLDEATKIHTICWSDWEDDEGASWPDPRDVEFCIHRLCDARLLVGHNIIGFDIPLIQKLYPGWKLHHDCLVLDTMVLSRLAYSNLIQLDWTRQKPGMPKNLYGSHSLEAWGYRLGILKGDFGKTNDWSQWSQEMENYCKQDVRVTRALWDHLCEVELSKDSILMEHQLQEIICAQERRGFCFDVEGAQSLAAKLQSRKEELWGQLQETFPPIPKKLLGVYGNQESRMAKLLEEWGEVEDAWKVEETRLRLEAEGIRFKWQKEQPFNPNSEKQIIHRLRGLGWEPIEFTAKGQPKMDEPILESVGQQFPEAAPLVEASMVEKRLGQIATGKNAWLKMVRDDGRIHGRCNTMGTVTYRFTHSSPNMGQVPGVKAPYGQECRGFFHVPPLFKLAGCDVSGLELRILAHYMFPWDNGAFAKEVVHGKPEDGTDVHSRNQERASLETRDQAKTFIYALLYGAGDAKLGSIALPKERNHEKLRKAGKALRTRFMRRTPALARLSTAVRQKAGKTKRLLGLDGRIIPIRSAHSSLNALIQSAGSIATKRATVHFRHLMEEAGYLMEKDWCLVAHVHDEWQTEVKQELADETARIAVRAIEEAGELLGLRCPITGEAKVGNNWAETH